MVHWSRKTLLQAGCVSFKLPFSCSEKADFSTFDSLGSDHDRLCTSLSSARRSRSERNKVTANCTTVGFGGISGTKVYRAPTHIHRCMKISERSSPSDLSFGTLNFVFFPSVAVQGNLTRGPGYPRENSGVR